MAQSNEIKIIVGGDAAAFKKAATDVVASAELIESSLQGAASASQTAATAVKSSFDAMAASKAAIDKLNASIDAAANAALQAGPKFDSLGGRLPLQDFNEFKRQIDVFKRDISSGFKFNFKSGGIIPPVPASVPDSFSKTKVGANQAAAALTNVGRVAQDLPFGFIGIQNNLNPLLESFQRLKAETGSSKAALSALGNSLVGAGGLGLALSVVTSAIVIYQNGISGFNKKTKEAKDEADKLAEALKAVKSSTDVVFEGEGNARAQVIQVQALAAAVGDQTKSEIERTRALEKLKDINKAYFGDLKLQEDSLRTLTPLVQEYTSSIIQQAVVTELSSEIGKIGAIFAKQSAAVSKAKDELNNYKESLNIPAIDKAGNRTFILDQNIDRLNLNLQNAQKELAPTAQKYNDLANALKDATSAALKFKSTDTKTEPKEVDLLKKRLESLEKIKDTLKDASKLVGIQESIFELQVKIAIRDQSKDQLDDSELKDKIQGFQDQLNKAFEKQALEFEAIPKVKFSQVVLADIPKNIESAIAKAVGVDKKITIPVQYDIDLKLFGKKFADTQQIARNQMEAVIGAIANGVQSAVTEGAAVIGEAFAGLISGEGVGSALAKAAQGLLAIIGGILQDVGKQIIVTSGLVAALKAALKGLFGPGGEAIGLAVGAALIATGALLKSIKFDVPKLADGGIATRATLGIFGEAGREAIIPLNKLPEIVGKLSTDNQQAIVINGNMRVDGTDLSLMLERVSGRRSRLG